MSRTAWMIVGLASFLAGCAASGGDDSNAAPGGDGGPTGQVDGTSAVDGSPGGGDAPGDDGGGSGDDTSQGGGGDTSTGDDGASPDAETDAEGIDAGIDAEGADANAPDSSTIGTDAGHDSGTTTPDAGHDSGTTTPDAGHDSGTTTPDAGTDAGCPPTTPTFTPTVHPPLFLVSCTSAQIQSFYNACLAGSTAACNTWAAGNAACNTCLAGSSSSSGNAWGPYVSWTAVNIVENNLGGCVLADPTAAGSFAACGDDLQYLTECEHAACDTSCAGNTLGNFQSCQTAADKDPSLCQSQNSAVSSACASVTSACFTGTTFETQFISIATVMCGP